MEILIVGALVVALMVYASTKIKKSVAAAFERETIEKQDFRLIKPEGFLSPINDESEFAFEAYTKEFGQNDAEEFRQASANLKVISNSSFEAEITKAKKTGGKILSENVSENASEKQKIVVLETEMAEKDIPVKVFYKIIESEKHHKIYNLQISVLNAYSENYIGKINEILESFVVR